MRPRDAGVMTRAATFAAIALVVPVSAWAHPGLAPAPHDVWRHWGASPAEWIVLLVPAIWYAAGVRALWRRAGTGRGVSRGQVLAFGAGMVTLAAALVSPLDAMAEALFSAHMVQHLLLILVAAPLLVMGAPLLPMLWAVPATSRHAFGRWWNRHAAPRWLAHLVTMPGVVFALHLVAMWFWHFPGPYQAALSSPVVHALEHAAFLGTAALFWWVVLPSGAHRRAGDGTAVLMIGGTLMQSGALGAVLMLASAPWYPAHAEGARAWGTTLLEDQQLAGLLMWVPASLVYISAAGWTFLRWMRRVEREDDRTSAPPRVAAHITPPLERAS